MRVAGLRRPRRLAPDRPEDDGGRGHHRDHGGRCQQLRRGGPAIGGGPAVRGGRDRSGVAVRGGGTSKLAAASQHGGAKAPPAATAQKTPQQQLEELQSLYKQGLISESDYNAAKAKILAQLSQ